MEKNIDGNFMPFMNFDMGSDPMMGENPMFNPLMQYEQAYMYYRCLSMQMEYKIKCKEYEKLCSNSRSERKVE